MRRWLLLWGALLACSAGGRPAAAAESPLTSLLRQETVTLATLESLAHWINAAEKKLAEVGNAAAQLDYQQNEAQRRSTALGQRLAHRRNHLQRRLRALYKMSRGGVVRLLLEAADAQDLSLRLSGASRVLDRDLQELRLYQRELAALQTQQQQLRQTQQRQQELRQELNRRQQQFQQAQQQQRALIERLRGSRRAQQRVARELSRYQRELLARIAASEARLAAVGGFARLRGQLRAPVAGPLAGRFGQITDKSQLEILRSGLTFAPAVGQPVQAVAPGTVQLAGPLEGYGQLVLLAHGEGYYTLYGFLAQLAVAPGAAVQAGARLGVSGRDPLSGKPALYFELRRGSHPVDPWPWLLH